MTDRQGNAAVRHALTTGSSPKTRARNVTTTAWHPEATVRQATVIDRCSRSIVTDTWTTPRHAESTDRQSKSVASVNKSTARPSNASDDGNKSTARDAMTTDRHAVTPVRRTKLLNHVVVGRCCGAAIPAERQLCPTISRRTWHLAPAVIVRLKSGHEPGAIESRSGDARGQVNDKPGCRRDDDVLFEGPVGW